MSKRIRKPVKKQLDFTDKILKILSQNENKLFNYKQIGAKLELDDTQSRNQIIKDLKVLASQKKIEEVEKKAKRISDISFVFIIIPLVTLAALINGIRKKISREWEEKNKKREEVVEMAKLQDRIVFR